MNTLRLNLPIVLTLSRILLVPVFIFSVYQHQIVGALIFGIASVTDYLDGFFARHSGKITKLGIILDPLADKFLVVSALVVLVDMERLPAWIAIIIIVREFLVTGLRAVALSKNVIIPAEMGGKIKTFTQIVAILCLILAGSVFDKITIVFVVIASFLLYATYLIQQKYKGSAQKIVAISLSIIAFGAASAIFSPRIDSLYDAGFILMSVALMLSIISGAQYTISFWRSI
jgi:CDP-diacylglycerol--glycerol-3-phosphate 3-phosphatidyltransferase